MGIPPRLVHPLAHVVGVIPSKGRTVKLVNGSYQLIGPMLLLNVVNAAAAGKAIIVIAHKLLVKNPSSIE